MKLPDFLSKGQQRARVALALGIVGGLLTALFYLLFRPSPPITFDVFYYAAKQSMDGKVVYETGYGLWTYTPASLLYFYPYALLFKFETALLIHQILSALVAVLYGVLLARFIDRCVGIGWVDKALIVGFTSFSVYPVVNVVSGQFNGIFAAMLGVGWILLENDNDGGGVAWALASIVKGFPAFWGVYLLRIGRWRATAAAIATGLGATAVGIVFFGIDAYVRFFTTAGSNRVRIHKFRGGVSPDNEAMTPIRGLAQLFPTVEPIVWVPVIIGVVVCLTLAVYALVPADTLLERATLLLATIIGVTFIMPTSQDMDTYLVYAPLLVLLYVERRAVVQSLYAIGVLLISYNVGRGELQTVSSVFGDTGSTVAMAIGEPVLTFAHMPMYGLYIIYTGILASTWLRRDENDRVTRMKTAILGTLRRG